jgi:hypothetical protein
MGLATRDSSGTCRFHGTQDRFAAVFVLSSHHLIIQGFIFHWRDWLCILYFISLCALMISGFYCHQAINYRLDTMFSYIPLHSLAI